MVTKKTSSKTSSHHERLLHQLIENTALLQKKDAELMTSTKKLIDKIDRMLHVFDEASKHVMEVSEDKKIANLTDKLDDLLNQNKTIAKGLIMLEQYVRKRSPM